MENNLICRTVLIIALLSSATLSAQQSSVDSLTKEPPRQITLSGPRIGVTFISGELADKLKKEYGAAPLITQFGWQFEQRFVATENGLTGLAEFVPLVGGIEQGLLLPSLNFLVGLRSAAGAEFGVGPNLSLSGVAYVFAAGATTRYGDLNIPINVSAVFTAGGWRLSVLFGFNMAR